MGVRKEFPPGQTASSHTPQPPLSLTAATAVTTQGVPVALSNFVAFDLLH